MDVKPYYRVVHVHTIGYYGIARVTEVQDKVAAALIDCSPIPGLITGSARYSFREARQVCERMNKERQDG